jgi:hypothetical protein
MDNWWKTRCGEGVSDVREGAVGSLCNEWGVMSSRKEDKRSGEVARTGGRGWKGVHGLEREMASLSSACVPGVQGREEDTVRQTRGNSDTSFVGLLALLGMQRL